MVVGGCRGCFTGHQQTGLAAEAQSGFLCKIAPLEKRNLCLPCHHLAVQNIKGCPTFGNGPNNPIGAYEWLDETSISAILAPMEHRLRLRSCPPFASDTLSNVRCVFFVLCLGFGRIEPSPSGCF